MTEFRTATYNFRQERSNYSCVKEDWADIELRCSLPLGLATQVAAKVRFMGLEGRHDVSAWILVSNHTPLNF